MSPQERFGTNVRRLRRDQGLTQEALAHASELHPTEVSRLERGVREPRLGTIVRVAHALGVRPAQLLDKIS
ncbi:MAG: helix-turn-helix domain-containing protein [Solirubrobacterales bacterium]